MNDKTIYPLKLPTSLRNAVAKIAKRDGTSINQFIAIAVAEKISALETERFFTERGKKADLPAFKTILTRKGGEPPRVGDELD